MALLAFFALCLFSAASAAPQLVTRQGVSNNLVQPQLIRQGGYVQPQLIQGYAQPARRVALQYSHPAEAYTYSQAPQVTYSQAPQVTYSRAPQVTYSQAPQVTYSQAPQVTYSQAPQVTYSRAPQVTYSQAPQVTYSRAPQVAYSQAPQVAVRHQPLASSGRPIAILRQAQDVSFDGTFSYGFESEDGTSVQASGGPLTAVGPEETVQTVTGSYTYISPEGTPITTNWIADENGFRAEGAHLPRAPETQYRSA